MGIDPETV